IWSGRRFDRVLQGHHTARRSAGRRQRGQRDCGVFVHGADVHPPFDERLQRTGEAVSLSQITTTRWPRLTYSLRRGAAEWNRIGEQMVFYVKILRQTGDAVTRYKWETMRVLAQMSLGVGALAAIGGGMMVVTWMVSNAGGIVGIIGHT